MEDYRPEWVDIAAAYPAPARPGTVVAFDGVNDAIYLAAQPGAALSGNVLAPPDRSTVAFWFQADDVHLAGPDASRTQVLFGVGDEEGGLSVALAAGRLAVTAWCADFGPRNVKETVLATAGVRSGQWHHLAVTNDESARPSVLFRAYLDGAPIPLESSSLTDAGLSDDHKGFPLDLTGTATLGGLVPRAGTLRLGGTYIDAAGPGPIHLFAGQITDLRVYQTALAPDARLRFEPPEDDDATLVYRLPLDEASGAAFDVLTPPARACMPGAVTAAWSPRNVVLRSTTANGPLENAFLHFAPDGDASASLGWSDYTYTGRLHAADAGAGIGVTLLSRHPAGENRLYAFRRYADRPTFHFSSAPDGWALAGASDSGIIPEAGVWYRFKIEVEDQPAEGPNGRTSLRAWIWKDGEEPPADAVATAMDESPGRLTAGTVGVWRFGSSENQYDDLEVIDRVSGERRLSEAFEEYAADEPPSGWIGTGDRVLFGQPATRFQTVALRDNQALRTASTQPNIHSHYRPAAGAAVWKAYVFTGRLRFTEATSGAGVTFFSDYPTTDAYYVIRRSKNKKRFHVASRRAGRIAEGDGTEIPLDTRPNVWYHFRIHVAHLPDHPQQKDNKGATRIQVRVWEEGTPEPAVFAIDVLDTSDPIASGTIGVWSSDAGLKFWDDLHVTALDPATGDAGAILYETDFETVAEGVLPAGWTSTGANHALKSAPTIFTVAASERHVLAPTTPTGEDHLTHYLPSGVDTAAWRNYVYTGYVFVPDLTTGMGMIVYSRYGAGEDRYYSLQRDANRPAFHLAGPDGLDRLQGDLAQAEIPVEPETWYRFRIQVDTVTTTATHLRARVWKATEPMPAADQIVAVDAGGGRIASGGVGLWAAWGDRAYFDDLRVHQNQRVLLSEGFVGLRPGEKPAGWVDTDRLSRFAPDATRFAARVQDDNVPVWRRVDDFPLWPVRGALRFDGALQYLATADTPLAPVDGCTFEAWVRPDRFEATQPIVCLGASPTDAFWFGLTRDGAPALGFQAGGNIVAAETTRLPTDRFSHVAASIAPAGIQLYVDGAPVASVGSPEQTQALYEALFDRATTGYAEIGRAGGAGALFTGDILEVRVWRGVRDADELRATGYLSSRRLSALHGDAMLAHWVAPGQGVIVPNLAGGPRGAMRLGGLEGARQPQPVARPLFMETGFWGPQRPVLTFQRPADAVAHPSTPTATLQRRTVELWFLADDVHASDRQQPLYREGRDEAGLALYLFAGRLYAGGYAGAAWPGSWLSTDRIRSGQWHHVALVLDGRSALKAGALQLYLDGKPVGRAPGRQLDGHAASFTLGGSAATARWHDAALAGRGEPFFAGRLLGLRRWETARSLDDLRSNRETLLDAADELALAWHGENTFGEMTVGADRIQLLGWRGSPPLPAVALDAHTLGLVAGAKGSMERHRLTVSRLATLLGESRLTGLHTETARALGLSTRALGRLMAIAGVDQVRDLRDFQVLSDRVAWTKATGIDLETLDLLINDIESGAATLRLDDASIRDLADALRQHAATFLVLPDALVSEGISQVESIVAVRYLGGPDAFGSAVVSAPVLSPAVLAADGAIQSTLFSGRSLTELEADPAWLTVLTALAGVEPWRATLSEAEALACTWSARIAAGLAILPGVAAGALAALQSARFVTAAGVVQAPAGGLTDEALGVVPGIAASAVSGVRGLLEARLAVQARYAGVLLERRAALENAVYTELSERLQADSDRTRTVVDFLTAEMPIHTLVTGLMAADPTEPLPADIAGPGGYLYRLAKTLHLVQRFALSVSEIRALLATPERFGLTGAAAIVRPTLADLDALEAYRTVRDDRASRIPAARVDALIDALADGGASATLPARVAALGAWDEAQAEAVLRYFGWIPGLPHGFDRIDGLLRLHQALALAARLDVDAGFLIDLAGAPSEATYADQRLLADTTLALLSARYNDESRPAALKPVRDALAVRKRDALLGAVMHGIPEDFPRRRDADLLYEYLLLDVQTGSVVNASRIQQAIASVQLYVQRCLMNLERGVDPSTIPQDQWAWMKNYRVWEANRKVFLYPENYIEPELRDTKTPFFAELEQELMQSDIDEAAVQRVYVNYLDRFREVATLKIVGTYLHRESDSTGVGKNTAPNPPDETLYLIGRTQTDPTTFYYRQRVSNRYGERWLPWKKIELTINATFVTPVFAFGKLFLFWPEFIKLKKSVQRRLGEGLRNTYTVAYLNDLFAKPITQKEINDKRVEITNLQNTITAMWFVPFGFIGILADLQPRLDAARIALTTLENGRAAQQRARSAMAAELSVEEMAKFDDKRWKVDTEYYLLNETAGARVERSIDIYNTTIKYSYFNLSGAWVHPQIYAALENELTIDDYRRPEWQRLYAQQTLQLAEETTISPKRDINALVARIDDRTSIDIPGPAFDMNALTLSFWARIDATGGGVQLGWKYTFSETIRRLLPDDLTKPLPRDIVDSIAAELINQTPSPVSAESLWHTTLLAGYDVDSLRVEATNVVAEIAGRTDVEAAVATVLGHFADARREAEAGDFAKTSSAADSAGKAATLGGFDPDRASELRVLADDLKSAADQAITLNNAADKAEAALAAEQAKSNPNTAEVNRLTKDATNAKNDANRQASETKKQAADAEREARIAQVAERLQPRWESNTVDLTVRMKGAANTLTVTVGHGHWLHVALTLMRTGDGYTANLYAEAPDQPELTATATLASPVLQRGKRVVLGSQSSAASGTTGIHMAEVRLWNSVRAPADIRANRNERLTGLENGLFYVPLNVAPAGSIVELTPPNGIAFFLPRASLVARERIILMYGAGSQSTIKSLRNNLEDQSFSLTLEPATAISKYDVQLSRDAASNLASPKAIVHLGRTDGLQFRDYATGEPNVAIYAPPRLAPTDADRQNYLIRNLEERESSLMDVNNLPGWYVVDTGDEQFLAKAQITRRGSTPQQVHTTRDRLRIRYSDNAVQDESAAQALAVYFEEQPDDVLTVTNDKEISVIFERLNTFAVHELSQNLFQGGLDRLLLDSQEAKEPNFNQRYNPNTALIDLEKSRLTDTIDFQGVNRLYYEELFFHIPFLIANRLNANQQFAEAQRWYHYIFNPTARDGSASKNRYWMYRPFRTFDASESIGAFLADDEALTVYREDPFDPHAIAGLRVFAYQKAVVMKYIDNLLDWGDALFRQDTREAINEAVLLYVMAYNLLGPRPQPKARRSTAAPGTYADIAARYASTGIPDFPNAHSTAAGAGVPAPHAFIVTDFCLIENQQFLGYWGRVEDRLYKIRQSLNIDGIFRQLALFEPPIDPAALVRAVAGGRDIAGALSDLNVAVPNYRYSHLLGEAREMIGAVIDLGASLQSALEARDAEALSQLENTHQKRILEMTTTVKTLAADSAREAIEALKINRARIEATKNRLDRLIDEDISPTEKAALILAGVGKGLQIVGSALKFTASLVEQAPEFHVGGAGISSPLIVTTHGGSKIANGLNKAGDVSNILGDVASGAGELTQRIADYERRRGGWEHERTIAGMELDELEFQQEMAQIALQTAERQLDIHMKELEHNQQIADFYRSKFTNQALYNWLATRLSSLYFQAYKVAYDTAKSAEKALQYEIPTTDIYIRFGHWDSLKKGLLAGEALLLDLNRMSKYHLDNDSRFQDIERIISMKNELPLSFLELVAGGECQFQLDEALFDRDYPGHYFRTIKTIALSIVPKAGVDQGQSIRLTLTQMGNKALLAPDAGVVRYLMGFDDAQQPDGNTLRVNWRSNQQIAVSKWQQDSGMFGQFDLNFLFDSRYFPFEGTGAVSTWRIEMPKTSNPSLDFSKIADVTITLRYTSKYDNGAFKQSVEGLLEELAGG
ncbi:MAG: LamG-like jellyroll fold domain-containing protein [Rhodothermales bacterium]|nr:LamG-like jellyroll fold domain-containing protein [Rhodothermales bacterium]